MCRGGTETRAGAAGKYYDRKVRKKRVFAPGDRLWLYQPPREPKASKLVNQWLGPVRVVESAGYDNYLVEREDVASEPEQFIAHSLFLVSYYYTPTLLKTVAADIEAQLEHEGTFELGSDEPMNGEVVEAKRARVQAATAAGTSRRRGRTAESSTAEQQQRVLVVELRRRRRRNAAGQYTIEYEVQNLRRGRDGRTTKYGAKRWVLVSAYDKL